MKNETNRIGEKLNVERSTATSPCQAEQQAADADKSLENALPVAVEVQQSSTPTTKQVEPDPFDWPAF